MLFFIFVVYIYRHDPQSNKNCIKVKLNKHYIRNYISLWAGNSEYKLFIHQILLSTVTDIPALHFISVLPGNWTHDLGIAVAVIYQSSYRISLSRPLHRESYSMIKINCYVKIHLMNFNSVEVMTRGNSEETCIVIHRYRRTDRKHKGIILGNDYCFPRDAVKVKSGMKRNNKKTDRNQSI